MPVLLFHRTEVSLSANCRQYDFLDVSQEKCVFYLDKLKDAKIQDGTVLKIVIFILGI